MPFYPAKPLAQYFLTNLPRISRLFVAFAEDFVALFAKHLNTQMGKNVLLLRNRYTFR